MSEKTSGTSRRQILRLAGAIAAAASTRGLAAADPGWAEPAAAQDDGYVKAPWDMRAGRPTPAERRFRSEAVEQFLAERSGKIGDAELRGLFGNCYPNTLDTTVEPGTFEGKPDTAVLTGDIQAMWLRDSSAQVWPYLPLASKDRKLRDLLEGVIRRQARCILIDPYANAFMADLSQPPLVWSRTDKTELKQGVGERKWEVDSLCYPVRLSHGYWKATGDTGPFDARWHDAVKTIVATFRVQQRKHGPGPYSFMRASTVSTEMLPLDGFGNPVKPVGLIFSGFRPSDDACVFPFLVPSNLFAVVSLRQIAEMANAILHDAALANDATALAAEVETALRQHAIVQTAAGTIWAYEVDGFGSQLLMDDANVPSLLGLPYLGAAGTSYGGRQCRGPGALCTDTSLRLERAQPVLLPGHGGRGHRRPPRRPGHDLADVADGLCPHQRLGRGDPARPGDAEGLGARLRLHARELQQRQREEVHQALVRLGQHTLRRAGGRGRGEAAGSRGIRV